MLCTSYLLYFLHYSASSLTRQISFGMIGSNLELPLSSSFSTLLWCKNSEVILYFCKFNIETNTL